MGGSFNSLGPDVRRAWVVGSINRDIVGYVARHGRAGETVLGTRGAEFPGGKGANQAVAIARLGGPVAMIGRVGRDGFGVAMRAFLGAEGVDTAGVSVAPSSSTGMALIVVDAQGENIITVLPGANLDWPDGVDARVFQPRARDVVVAQLEVPHDIVASAFRQARAVQAVTVFNPSPFDAAAAALLLPLADIVVLNEGELQAAAGGGGIEDNASIRQACGSLFERGVQVCVVTLGAKGAVVVTSTGLQRVDGMPVEVRDTTGAGDCFTGALVAELLRGSEAAAAARFAVKAAALSVTRDGAAASYPRRTEVA